MAVKARATVTISRIIDISAITRYYMLQSSTAAAPAKPTTVPALIGKNAFNIAFALNVNNWVNYKNGYFNYCISGLKPNAMYTFSMSANNWSGVKNNGFYVSINNTPSTYSSHPIAHSNGVAGFNPKKGTLESNISGEIYLQFYNVSADRLSTFFNGCPNFQLELGSEATEYQKYVTPNWQLTEPSYTSGSTKTLYFVDCTEFTNGTFKYSEVSKSSSYEAAKEAYNKAQNAQNNVDSLTTRVSEAEANIALNKKSIELRATKTEVETTVNNIKVGGRNILLNSSFKENLNGWDSYATPISGSAITLDGVSSIEHEMWVKVRRKNLLPPAYSGIYYKGSIAGGKPFIYNSSYGISDFNNIDISSYRGVYAVIRLTEGETYTLTINNLVNNCATKQITLAVGFRSSDSTIFGTGETKNSVSSGYNQSSLTFTVPSGYPYCLVGFYNYPTVSGDTVSFDAMQLELGTTATNYTQYVSSLTAVKIKRLGKNLFDNIFEFSNKGVDLTSYGDYWVLNGDCIESYNFTFKQNNLRSGTYTFSTLQSSNIENNKEPIIQLQLQDIDDGRYIYYNLANNNVLNQSTTFTIDKEYICNLRIRVQKGITYDNYYIYPQLELGTTATDYEPYKECAEYTPTADGTVEGVTSLYPNTTLMSDTDGVLIDCEYKTGAFVEKYDKLCCKLSNNSFNLTKYCAQQLLGKIESNTEYTLSGWILSENVVEGATNPLLSLYGEIQINNGDAVDTTTLVHFPFDINSGTSSWKYISTTFTSPSDLSNVSSILFSIFARDVKGEFYFYNLKLEKGNKATDWEPAYEDTETDIEKVAAIANSNKESISSLLVNTDSISASVSKLQTDTVESIDGIKKDISTLKHAVDVAITSEDVQIQIQNEMSKGSTKVVTNTGFTFDEDGLNISKSNSPTNTQITENGMTVNNTESGKSVLTANKDGVDAVNLRAKTYLIIGGRSRFENYETNRTGCFWIGE